MGWQFVDNEVSELHGTQSEPLVYIATLLAISEYNVLMYLPHTHLPHILTTHTYPTYLPQIERHNGDIEYNEVRLFG